MDRHIASHPVTVTEGDTVTRASRHIGPPLEGAVYVTLDQPERRRDQIKHVDRPSTQSRQPLLRRTENYQRE